MPKIPTYAWVLPRPSSAYRGSFPLHFETKLSKLLCLDSNSIILQPFGGVATLGIKIDMLREVKPDIIADAHHLPVQSGICDVIILDPPYSNEYSKELFNIKQKLKLKTYLKEAIRVLKEDGFLVFYHMYPIPCPRGCRWFCRILLEHRMFHKLRWVGIFKKGLPDRLKLKQKELFR